MGRMFVKVVWRAGAGRRLELVVKVHIRHLHISTLRAIFFCGVGDDMIKLVGQQPPPHHVQELICPSDPEVGSPSTTAPEKLYSQAL